MNKEISVAALKLLYPIALMAAVAAMAYQNGFQTASKKAAAEKAGIIATYQAAALSAEQQYSAALAEAAADKQKWFDSEQGRLKQEIPDAIAKDEKSSGACHSGLGAHSLRLYNRALGYPD